MNQQKRYLSLTISTVCVIALALVRAMSSSGANRTQAAASQGKVSAWPQLTVSRRLGACAREDTGDFFTNRKGSSKELVPSGPIAVTVCRYNHYFPSATVPDDGLEAAGMTANRSAIDSIAHGLNSMTPGSNGPTSCPQIPTSTIATFVYRNGPPEVVVIEGGCGGVGNGQRYRGVGGEAAQTQLQQLAKPVKLRWATIVGTCTPSCEGAVTVEAAREHVILGTTGINYSGHFRMLVALSGRYALTLYRVNTIVSRTAANVTIGHTTAVRFRLK